MSKPIQSRHGLTRCTACRAHIRAADRPSATVCPFCGANLQSGRPLISLPTGRGGILAASLLAFGAMGCGGADAESSSEPTVTAEPSQTGDDDPADQNAPNQNAQNTAAENPAAQEQGPQDPSGDDDPGYADPVDEPVAVEAYGGPPIEELPTQPAPSEPAPPQDSFRPTPSEEHRPAPRYGLAPGVRPGPTADPFGDSDF